MATEPPLAGRPAIGRGRALPLACLIGLALVGALTLPFHWASTALVIAVGSLAAALAVCPARFLPWTAPRGSGGDRPDGALRGAASTPAALRRGVLAWSTLLVALLAWQGYAYLRQPDRSIAHDDYPTLSTLLDPLLEQGPGRFAGWLAWLAAGWWLVRR
ncbi:hypothetical protein FEK35_12415 [Nocardia cyriacigeorgica]|uniref:Uncharacterized protein n=1 Tax=Nocardia cyriacigeorgica TaxID=135487 RepID=A0A5R8PF47_9NOCA|nr:hypothetical protein [Nocardia cyriacigeorgica]TLG11493.1 hypothetical protein FEK35_12415 [Nocardia cyriacigeorgica]